MIKTKMTKTKTIKAAKGNLSGGRDKAEDGEPLPGAKDQ